MWFFALNFQLYQTSWDLAGMRDINVFIWWPHAMLGFLDILSYQYYTLFPEIDIFVLGW
jgi:hypothetical protein